MQIMAIKGEVAWPARKVWSVVSDFGGLKQWNPAVITCTQQGQGVGAERVFVTRAATVKERIDSLDDAGMKIGYSIVSGSTIPVKDGKLTISVRALDDQRSEVTWTFDGQPEGIALADLKAQVDKRYLGRLDDLRNFLASTTSAR